MMVQLCQQWERRWSSEGRLVPRSLSNKEPNLWLLPTRVATAVALAVTPSNSHDLGFEEGVVSIMVWYRDEADGGSGFAQGGVEQRMMCGQNRVAARRGGSGEIWRWLGWKSLIFSLGFYTTDVVFIMQQTLLSKLFAMWSLCIIA